MFKNSPVRGFWAVISATLEVQVHCYGDRYGIVHSWINCEQFLERGSEVSDMEREHRQRTVWAVACKEPDLSCASKQPKVGPICILMAPQWVLFTYSRAWTVHCAAQDPTKSLSTSICKHSHFACSGSHGRCQTHETLGTRSCLHDALEMGRFNPF